MPRLFCYECEHESEVADVSESAHRCPACNSDFCEVLSASRQGTHQQTGEPHSSQQQPRPQSQPDSSMNEESSEHGGGVEGDNASNTTRHTTRFSMPNGHSYEVNFTTHVFQPGMDFHPGMPPAGTMLRSDGTGSQMFMVLGGGGSGPPSNETLVSLFGNMGATPGDNARFSPADFGMGQTLESLLAQLAELHQTREQPTAVAFRESLPRLRVAASGSPTFVSPATAAGDHCVPRPQGIASCSAGDTCCVCRNEFAAGTEVVQLPCDHCFDEACIMPWLEMHSTCPVCRRKLPHEDLQPQQAAVEAAAAEGPARVSPHRTRSATRMAAQETQRSAGHPGRRVGSNGPLQAGSTGGPGDEDGNANMATMVMQQLASLVTGQLGQMGFTVPPDLAQQLQQAPQQGQFGHPQLRLHMQLPFSVPAPATAATQPGAEEPTAAAGRARRSELRNIESHVTELRRLQALYHHLQAPSTEAQFQQQLAQLRLLGATLQQRLAAVDTAYSTGTRQHDCLQTQVRTLREQVATLRRNEQREESPSDGDSRSDPTVLQTALVQLLAFEDSLATAAGQLNVCRQSRQGLRDNQRLINRHIASFDGALGGRCSQGQPSDGTPAHHLSRQRSEAPNAPSGGSTDSTEAAINGDSIDADHPLTSAIRPASSPAEGDGGGDHNRRRVRARTDQGEGSSGRAAAISPHMAFVLGQAPPAVALPLRHLQADESPTAQPDEAQSADGRQGTSGTVRPFHSSAPTESPAVAASRVSQGFSLPLHAVPGAFGRLFGGLRGIFGWR